MKNSLCWLLFCLFEFIKLSPLFWIVRKGLILLTFLTKIRILGRCDQNHDHIMPRILIRKAADFSPSSLLWTLQKNFIRMNSESFVYCTIGLKSFVNVAFFQEVRFVFQISKSPKKYSEKLSWTWNLNFPPITVNCYWQEI